MSKAIQNFSAATEMSAGEKVGSNELILGIVLSKMEWADLLNARSVNKSWHDASVTVVRKRVKSVVLRSDEEAAKFIDVEAKVFSSITLDIGMISKSLSTRVISTYGDILDELTLQISRYVTPLYKLTDKLSHASRLNFHFTNGAETEGDPRVFFHDYPWFFSDESELRKKPLVTTIKGLMVNTNYAGTFQSLASLKNTVFTEINVNFYGEEFIHYGDGWNEFFNGFNRFLTNNAAHLTKLKLKFEENCFGRNPIRPSLIQLPELKALQNFSLCYSEEGGNLVQLSPGTFSANRVAIGGSDLSKFSLFSEDVHPKVKSLKILAESSAPDGMPPIYRSLPNVKEVRIGGQSFASGHWTAYFLTHMPSLELIKIILSDMVDYWGVFTGNAAVPSFIEPPAGLRIEQEFLGSSLENLTNLRVLYLEYVSARTFQAVVFMTRMHRMKSLDLLKMSKDTESQERTFNDLPTFQHDLATLKAYHKEVLIF